MLLIGYVFALGRAAAVLRVQVNLAYRCSANLSVEDQIPDHSVFSRARMTLRESGALRPGV